MNALPPAQWRSNAPLGGSTLITSAPMSARYCAPAGPLQIVAEADDAHAFEHGCLLVDCGSCAVGLLNCGVGVTTEEMQQLGRNANAPLDTNSLSSNNFDVASSTPVY